jgi:hypothetical protein
MSMKITSFGGLSLEQRFSKYSRRGRYLRSTHVPIRPSSFRAENEKAQSGVPSLTLRDDGHIPRNSYVNAREVYSIDWLHLKPYTDPSQPSPLADQRLDYKSVNTLLRHSWQIAGYLPGPQQVFGRSSIQIPNPALATPWRPPPVPIKPYPALFMDDSKPRPILSVVIPGMDKASISSKRSVDSETLVESALPSGCLGSFSLMFSMAGATFARTLGSMCGRS